MIHKFLRQMPGWCLVIVLTIFQQCSCLPDSSKEIDKVRARDSKRKVYFEKYDIVDESLEPTKNKITQLTGKSLIVNIDEASKLELTKTCQEFLEQKYIPFLQAQKEYLVYILKCEADASKKKKYTDNLQHAKAHLLYVEKLLQGSDLEEWCKFIINNINL